MREDSVSQMFMDIDEIKQVMQSIESALTNSDKEVDWEQRRYEIAKSAMNAMLANPELLQVVTSKEYVVGTFCQNRVAKVSVDYADALIAELKKKGE